MNTKQKVFSFKTILRSLGKIAGVMAVVSVMMFTQSASAYWRTWGGGWGGWHRGGVVVVHPAYVRPAPYVGGWGWHRGWGWHGGWRR